MRKKNNLGWPIDLVIILLSLWGWPQSKLQNRTLDYRNADRGTITCAILYFAIIHVFHKRWL